ncbi:MAG TPA: winged helix-turn-helix domain-containing protein, partial [Sphingomicrobium sp.]|nr:winged helix-turn-helix domain-containing protein [Sphingomicrobium sp.]
MHGATDPLLTTAELSLRADFPLGLATVSPSARRVDGPGGGGAVEPRVMQILVVLAEAKGKVVTRDTLFRRCWGGVYVGEDSLNRAIAGARRIAEIAGAGSFAIETIPRTGYRLTSSAASDGAPASATPAYGAAVASALEVGVKTWRLGLPAVPADAIACLRAAAELAPDRADVWGLLALLLRDAAEYAEPADCAALVGECEGAAGRALAIDATEDNARTALACLPPLFGGWLEARERLVTGRSAVRASSASAHAVAVLEMATGRPSAAIPIIEQLIEDDPLAAIYAYKRVYHLWTLGRLSEMDRVADRAMQLWPAHPAIWFARWWSLACTGR